MPSKKTKHILIVLITSSALLSTPIHASSDSIDRPRFCLEMANYAKKWFIGLQKLDKDLPNQRASNIEGVRQYNFDQYKNATNTSQGPATSTAADIKRKWGEIGINEYTRSPEENPDTVERRIYGFCIEKAN